MHPKFLSPQKPLALYSSLGWNPDFLGFFTLIKTG